VATRLELPDLASDYTLDQDTIDAFRRDGHTVVRGLASSEEADAYRAVIEDAALRHNVESRPLEDRETYGKAFLQIPNLWVKDDGVRQFVFARRFARVAAQLMGVDGVRLYHDQALFKEAGGGLTPFHQDQYYWPLDTDHTITMWMPMIDVPAELGSMTFASGSHKLGFLGEFEISDESEAVFRTFIEDNGIPLTTHGALAAGDATFHAGWTLHGAPPNETDRMRSVMTVIYFADGTRASQPDNKYREADLANWLGGIKPGDVATGELNPLLFRER
jgi:ectoine hydroxylase-related dioxygenase (phytanoyl-CoA dioxygenase family)